MKDVLEDYLKKIIVLDTKSSYIYIGTLISIDDIFLTLHDVDVHDNEQCIITKERYMIEALKYGVKVNRKKVRVAIKDVISVSLLEDIVRY